jgi:hypothetical protein
MPTRTERQSEYVRPINAKVRAFREIARALGPDHPITKNMGTLAWGRHKHELGPEPRKDSAIYANGFLEGQFEALNQWAANNDRGAQRTMLDIWSKETRNAN